MSENGYMYTPKMACQTGDNDDEPLGFEVFEDRPILVVLSTTASFLFWTPVLNPWHQIAVPL
jgi:hypothetical protein